MKNTKLPAFKNESEEADWWASREGRDYVKQKSAVHQESAQTRSQGQKIGGSRLVDSLSKNRGPGFVKPKPEHQTWQPKRPKTSR